MEQSFIDIDQKSLFSFVLLSSYDVYFSLLEISESGRVDSMGVFEDFMR